MELSSFYATKGRTTHTYDTSGKRPLITQLLAQSGRVTQVKPADKNGYQAIQLGFGMTKKVNKALAGHLKGVDHPPRFIKEVRMETLPEIAKNAVVAVVQVLHVGDQVSVHAKMIGKGFAGVVKRWGFAGGPKTHGQSDRHRAPGSIGQGTTPGRVYRGKKMAGHMGNQSAAVLGGVVVKVDPKAESVWVTGTVPGKPGELVRIKIRGHKEFGGLWGEEVKPMVKPEESVAENSNL